MLIRDQFISTDLIVHGNKDAIYNYNAIKTENESSLLYILDNDDDQYDEYLFLPITNEEFKKRRKKYTGYGFVFDYRDISSISMIGIKDIGFQIKMKVTAYRFFFRPGADNNINILEVRQPLFPALIYTETGKEEEVRNRLIAITNDSLNQFTEHYILNRI